MQGRWFYDADGELLIVPQQGRLHIETELGVLDVEPQEIAIVPRGIRFRVALPDGASRGYMVDERSAGRTHWSHRRSEGQTPTGVRESSPESRFELGDPQ